MTATRLATQKEMGQKSASGTTPPISAKPVKGNFRIARRPRTHMSAHYSLCMCYSVLNGGREKCEHAEASSPLMEP